MTDSTLVANTDDAKSVSLKNLADELGYSQASMRKTVERRGFVPFQLGTGSNKPNYLSAEDATKLRNIIENEKNNRIPPGRKTQLTATSGVYFIEIPSYSGISRIKIGWSDKLKDRFDTYRTIVPDLRIWAVWHTSDEWCERAALRCAEKLGRRIHQELFEFPDIPTALDDLISLFEKLAVPVSLPGGEIDAPVVDAKSNSSP
ncbi:MAG: hypothetical protein COY49_00905 [Comamonadaceae bacterium CG_4_10_14_0_8_um_filter_57_29]|nr:MAG: hypothetical protein COY49_00905 [Comamonadaceae bacterium CG_4_10_14_0_8_um_filter_57_29]